MLPVCWPDVHLDTKSNKAQYWATDSIRMQYQIVIGNEIVSQTAAVIKTLKRQLKAAGKTYQDVAQLLGLSEASIKRLFSEKDLSLSRLESICDAIGMDLAQLMQQVEQDSHKLMQLTHEQEQSIVDDETLFLVAVCVMNGYGYGDILGQYKLDKHLLVQKLVVLDQLGVIELHANNRIKLLLAPNFNWLPNGPIQQFFHETIKQEFFKSDFTGEAEKLLVANGLISRNSNVELQRRMQKLINEFTEKTQRDSNLPLETQRGTTLVVAIRQWQSSLFDQFER